MLVVGKVLGRQTLLLYLLSIVGGAMAFGLGVDYLLPREWFTAPIEAVSAGAVHSQGWFNIACTVVLTLLLVNALVLRFRTKADRCECEQQCDAKLPDSGIKEQIYYIDGLRCNHCRTNAQKAIEALEGVESVDVDLPTGRAQVRGVVSEAQVQAAVEALGFKLRKN